MVKQKNKILLPIVWLSLFIAIFAYCQYFLSYNYPFVEQFSFFRFSKEYALSTMNEPGGLANYVASFLTQFYYYPVIGPLISATLAVLITAFLDLTLKKISSRYYFSLLSSLPALSCIWLETDFNYYLSGTVSLALAVMAFWVYAKSAHLISYYIRLVALTILSWPLYYMLGPNALLLVGLCVIFDLTKSDKRSLLGFFALLVAVLCPFTLFSMELGKELSIQLLPKGYYVEVLSAPHLSYYPWIAMLLNVILAKTVAAFSLSVGKETLWFNRVTNSIWAVGIQFMGILGIMHWGVIQYNSATNYEVKILDYYSRRGQWSQLLQDEHLRASKNFMHTCYQNLALSSLNLLGDKMFACPQTGFPGLFIKWNKTVNSSTLLSDVYWQLGDVALAQEMAFEGMVASREGANPRLLMRLVQTNLIEENYPVAEKYINLLADTYSYSSQAEKYRKLLYHDEAVLADPELGPRKKGMKGVGLTNTDQIMDDLLIIMRNNPDFVPPFHYFAAACLMVKDIPLFKRFIEEFHAAPALAKMPVHLQEAIILTMETDSDRWNEFGVSAKVQERYQEFRNTFLSYRHSPMLKRKMAIGFRDTYWYYYMFKK